MRYLWTSSDREWKRTRPSAKSPTNSPPHSLPQLPILPVPPSRVQDLAPLLRLPRLRSHIIPTRSHPHYLRRLPYRPSSRRTPWRCEKRSPSRATTTRGLAAVNVSSCDVLLRLGLCRCSSRLGHVVRDSPTLRFPSHVPYCRSQSSPPSFRLLHGILHSHSHSSRSVLSVRRFFRPSALIVLPVFASAAARGGYFRAPPARAPRPHPTERSCYHAFLCHYDMHLLLRLTIHVSLNPGFGSVSAVDVLEVFS